MIVVDTNVLVALELDGPLTAQAHRLVSADPEWRLPSLWRYEFANVMVTMARHGLIGPNDGRSAMRRALGHYSACEAPVELEAALELAMELKLSAYDASFLALAKALGLRLVTLDKALVAKSQGAALGLKDFLDGGFVAGESVPTDWPATKRTPAKKKVAR